MNCCYGPMVKHFNPLRLRVWRSGGTWTARYQLPSREVGTSGARSCIEAVRSVRRMATMRVAYVEGEFVRVARGHRCS